jgi:hypothetical protein
MPRFRKRPVVVDAWKFDHEQLETMPYWLQAYTAGLSGDLWHLPTLEGVMRADAGDWIIRGVQGEVYPCKPDIFEQTYEPADA